MAVTYTAPNSVIGSVLSTTLRNISRNIPDQVTEGLILFHWLTSKGRKRYYDGGQAIALPLMLAHNTTAKSYRGYDVGDAAPQEGITQAIFPWRQLRVFITISGLEDFQNGGQWGVANLLSTKVDQAVISIQNEMNRQVYEDGSGPNSTYKDILGLKAIVPANYSSSPVSIGMISTNNSDWAPKQSDGDSLADLTALRSAIRTLYNDCSKGRDHPTIILSNQYIYEYYERTLVSQERYQNTDVASGDFEGLLYKGTPWFFDRDLPLGQGDQSDEGSIYMLNHKHLWLAVARGADFTASDFMMTPRQDAYVASIKFYGNLVTDMRNMHGILWDVPLTL